MGKMMEDGKCNRENGRCKMENVTIKKSRPDLLGTTLK